LQNNLELVKELCVRNHWRGETRKNWGTKRRTLHVYIRQGVGLKGNVGAKGTPELLSQIFWKGEWGIGSGLAPNHLKCRGGFGEKSGCGG